MRQTGTRVAHARLAQEHPKAVKYLGALVHTGTQDGQMLAIIKQTQALSSTVAFCSFFAGTMTRIEKKSLHGIKELKTIGAMGLLLDRQLVEKDRRQQPRRRTTG